MSLRTLYSSDTHHSPPKKKARSDVWEHYKLVEGEKKVLCMLCNTHKKISTHGGTSNLRDHLTSQHPSVYKKNTTAKQTSLLDFSKRSRCSESQSKEITKLIMELVIRDVCALCFVEGAGFLQLMSFIEPSYKVPSAVHFSKLIHQKYMSEKIKLKGKL